MPEVGQEKQDKMNNTEQGMIGTNVDQGTSPAPKRHLRPKPYKPLFDILQTALWWTGKGQSVIPIRYKDKRPDVYTWEPYKTTIANDLQLAAWFGKGDHNIGVITGFRNLVVLDFDNMAKYTRWLFYTKEQGKEWLCKNTYQVKTSRGMHVYFRLPYPQRTLSVEGIDIKGRYGYVLAPPSVHPSGVPYIEQNRLAVQPITSLSDVLPPSLLARDVSLPPEIRMPLPLVNPIKSTLDPWETADNAGEASESVINKIKRRYKITDFFINTEKTSTDGRWLITRCPLHDDHDPSMWIDTAQQLCGCYAGCTPKPLDVINLYARLNGLSNKDAIQIMLRGK